MHGSGQGSSLVVCVGILTGYMDTLYKMLMQLLGNEWISDVWYSSIYPLFLSFTTLLHDTSMLRHLEMVWMLNSPLESFWTILIAISWKFGFLWDVYCVMEVNFYPHFGFLGYQTSKPSVAILTINLLENRCWWETVSIYSKILLKN